MRRLWLLLLLTGLAIACTYKPPADPNARPGKGMNFFPEWFDSMIAEQYGELYLQELPVLKDAPVQRGVEELGRDLVKAYYGAEKPPYNFQFHVVNLDIMNAFALPGGQVFVFRGLLQRLDSEAELAGVLSHEMGHVVARHGTKSLSKEALFSGILLGTSAVLAGEDHEKLATITYIGGSIALSVGMLKYSRDYEREADWVAVHNCYRAGYNPEAMISLFEHFKKDEDGKPEPQGMMFLATHPSPAERQKNVDAELPKLNMARQWNNEQFGFTTMTAELKSLPPAPRDLDGKPALSFTSLDSLGNAIAASHAKQLKHEYDTTGQQTIRIYVPSDDEWTDTSIQVKKGQRLRFVPEGRNLSQGVGSVKGCIKKDEKVLQSFDIGSSTSVTVESAGSLYLGINDNDYSDNAGWYVVTTTLR